MTDEEWDVLFARVKKNAAAIEAKYRSRPDTTVCPDCDHPHLGTCERCGKDGCMGFGGFCCLCCDIEAIEFWKANPL